MHRLLALACRAFPPDHRARTSDEVVDTAVLASRGLALGALREALSLVGAGLWQRLRSESGRSLQDGVRLLARVLAVANLAVAVAGVIVVTQPLPIYHSCPVVIGSDHSSCAPSTPFVVDWWWIASTAAAAAIVLGLVLGNRLLAAGAALANLGLLTYDAFVLVDRNEWFTGHLSAFAYGHPSAFPVGREWFAAAVVLALATAAAPLRRLPFAGLPLMLVAALPLVAISRELPGRFFFLLWLLAAIVALAIAFGALAPRLVVLAAGGVFAALSGVFEYFTERPFRNHPFVLWTVAGGLALGLLVPLARLTRRRLT